jgi:hypothetical protein
MYKQRKMNWEGRGNDLFDVLPQNLPGGPAENHEINIKTDSTTAEIQTDFKVLQLHQPIHVCV